MSNYDVVNFLLWQSTFKLDIEDAKKALAELGKNISAQDFWKQLGLE